MERGKTFNLVLAMAVLSIASIVATGCGDDDNKGGNGTGVDLLTVADFEGSWVATDYEVTHRDEPKVSIELVSAGGTFSLEANDAGAFTGLVTIPRSLGGPLVVHIQGMVHLVTQDSIRVSFSPEFPPLLTDFVAEFELDGNTLNLLDEKAVFDFERDGSTDPAIFEGVMVRQ